MYSLDKVGNLNQLLAIANVISLAYLRLSKNLTNFELIKKYIFIFKIGPLN